MAEEYNGPYANWLSVPPSGDTTGATDTAALQTELNKLGRAGPPALAIKGAYYINDTLRLTPEATGRTDGLGVGGITFLGHSRSDTIITWKGAPGGTMIRGVNVGYGRYGRFTLDGAGQAKVFIEWDFNEQNNYFPTANLWEDLRVINPIPLAIAPGARRYVFKLGERAGVSEWSYWRLFVGTGFDATLYLRTGNVLDHWIWDSWFNNAFCVGGHHMVSAAPSVPAEGGQGNFMTVNRSVMNRVLRSFAFVNTGHMASRWNYQLGGSQHWDGGGIGTARHPSTIQGLTLIDPTGQYGIPIVEYNPGPLLLVDNHVRYTPAQAGAPTVEVSEAYSGNPTGDVIDLGCRYSTANPIKTGARRRVHSADRVIGTVTDPGLPPQPVEPPAVARAIFEPAAKTLSAVQKAVSDAKASGAVKPVVHLPSGRYAGTTTIVVPANWEATIEGDGPEPPFGAELYWDALTPGLIMRLEGPTLVTLKHFGINSHNGVADGIEAVDVNQPGGLVQLRDCGTGLTTKVGMLVSDMPDTPVEALNTGFGAAEGAEACVRATGKSRVVQVNGTMGGSATPYYDVQGGSTICALSVYSESGSMSNMLHPNGNGTFLWDGGKFQGGQGATIDASKHTGMVTVCNVGISPDGVTKIVPGENFLGLGLTYKDAAVIDKAAAGGTKWAIWANHHYAPATGYVQAPEQVGAGVLDSAQFLRDQLAPLRASKPSYLPATLVPGTTSLLIQRVRSGRLRTAFKFSGRVAPPPPPPLIPVEYQQRFSVGPDDVAGLIAGFESELAALNTKLSARDTTITSLEADIAKLRADLAALAAANTTLGERLAVVEAALVDAKNRLQQIHDLSAGSTAAGGGA